MNKKFSTLVASFLLAGGLFSSANAVDFKAVAGNGQVYKIVRVAENAGSWQAVTAKAYIGNGEIGDAADLFTIEKNGTGISLKNVVTGELLEVESVTGFTVSTSLPKGLKLGEGVDFNELQSGKKYLGQASSSPWVLKMVSSNVSVGKREAFDAEATSLKSVKGNYKLEDGLVFRFVTADEESGIYVATVDPETKKTYSFKTNATGEALYITGEGESENDFKVQVTDNGALLVTPSGKYVSFAEGEWSLVSDLENATLFAFEATATTWVTAPQLNAFSNGDFSVTVLYQDNDGEYTKTDIAGNPFTGTLIAVPANDDKTKFYIQKGTGNNATYIVAKKYEGEGADKKQAIYDFTTMKVADYEKHVSRANAGLVERVYYAVFAGEIEEEDLDKNGAEITGITDLYVSLNDGAKGTKNNIAVGGYDFSGVRTLVASNTTKLYPIYVKLGSYQVVNPADLLVKGKFYTVELYNATDKVWEHLVGAPDDLNNSRIFTNSFGNVLETQFALTVDETENVYVFTNRESGIQLMSKFIGVNDLYYTSEANVYECGDRKYRITPVAEHAATDGYVTLDVTETAKFNIAYASSVYGNAWFAENHKDGNTVHTIGLDTDIDNALTFTATEYAATRKYEEKASTNKYTPTDSIYVISKLGYYDEYGVQQYTLDTLKIVSYSFVNQWGEPLKYNNNRYVSYVNKNVNADKFALRQDNGKLNLRVVYNWNDAYEAGESDDIKNHQSFGDYTKVYAGDASNGILSRTYLYDRTENDLFVVEATDVPQYRRLVNDLETISIYRDANSSELLCEEGALLSVENENGQIEVLEGFLGLKNANQFKFAPAMLADTAYVRNETHKPLYMLAVDVNVVEDGKWCETHQTADCEHATPTTGWVEGRYLVCLADSANAWDEGKHKNVTNPYRYDGMDKLGFVQATHRNDSLIIASSDKQIYLGNNKMNPATFAFRYVDVETGSFVIETDCGYIKWINGNVVVTEKVEDAEVFNMNEEETSAPTANETISASAVTVVAGEGNVTIAGAAGKKVVIANILGQTIANTVLTSDNATIAAPAGVVVVAVEGEAAVKAIVK